MIKKIIRRLTLFACTLCLILSVSIGLAACVNGKDSQGIYYLSLQSESWQTYNSEKDIPEKYLFKQSGDKDIYELEIALGKDEQFTVNDLGSGQKISYANIFSADENLVEGENQSIKVAHQGTYKLAYDEKNKTLTYGYTATLVSVSISAPTTSLYVGDSYTFVGTALYSDETTASNVTWSTSDPSVVTVSDVGLVSAISEGTAIIKASMGDLSDEVTVNVQNPDVKVTGVQLDKTKVDLELGSTVVLTATVLPENATSKGVLYTSENDDVATVEQDGTVKAVGYGSTIITVTTNNGGFSAECEVTVVRHVDAIRLDAEEITVVANGMPKTVSVSFSPADSTNMALNVQVTSGEEFVSVSKDGNTITVQGLAEGEATVRVVSEDNSEAEASFTVKVLAADAVLVSLPNSVKLMIGEEQTIEVKTENTTISSVAWTVEDEIVSVRGTNDRIQIEGLAFGTTTLQGRYQIVGDNTYYYTTCSIQVCDEFFFIYGYGLGDYDWDYEDYVSDKNAAEKANLLFEEVQNGIYTLTRYFTPQNGFQIIFPSVASYVDEGTQKWDKNIPSESVAASEYFDEAKSDTKYVSNESTYFKVNTAGVYQVTLDLTGSSAKVYIKNISVDLSSVTLNVSSGKQILKNGDNVVINFEFQPAAALVEEGEFMVAFDSVFTGYADYLTYEVNFANRTVTVTVTKDPKEEIRLNIVCSVGEISASLELIILPESAQETPVTEICFEQEHYYFNVNNGEGNWTTTVKATVNEDATIQQVKYKLLNTSYDYFTIVDPDSGEITRRVLGTSELQAIAIGDESVTATCYVTFYSDVLYLTGEFNDNNSYDVFNQNITSLNGNAQYENYLFTMDSPTHFTLKVTLSQPQSLDGGREQYGFQIAHLGMDAGFTSLIYSCANDSLSKDYFTYFGQTSGAKPSWRVRQDGTYILEVDLSGVKPSAIFNKADTPLQKIFLDTDRTTVKKGETVKIALSFNPYSAVPEEEIEWSYLGNGDGYLSCLYDAKTKTLSVNVVKNEHAEDKEVSITCTIGDVSTSLELTIVAEHHLVKEWNDTTHWLSCTDKGCGYTEGETAHSIATAMTSNDPEGHYYACEDEGCGYKSDLTKHTVSLQNGWFNFAEDQECECGFRFYTIEDGTLTGYYANAQYVKIPDSVTAIGNNVFAGHSEILILTLPNQLQSIGTEAFKDCSGLLTVMIPRTVTNIGESAFSGVSASITWEKNSTIEEINGFQGYLGSQFTFPESAKRIYNYGFSGSHLTSIVIPDRVRLFGYVFKDCLSLEWAIVGKAGNIGGGVFQNCVSLKWVFTTYDTSFHEGLVEDHAFEGCTNFEALYFPFDYSAVNTPKMINLFTPLGNDVLIGHCYAYAAEQPEDDSWLLSDNGKEAPAAKYFAGTWHYIDGEERSFDNVAIWDTAKTVSTQTTLFYIEKRKEMFD